MTFEQKKANPNIESLKQRLESIKLKNKSRQDKQIKVLEKIRNLSLQANLKLLYNSYPENHDLPKLLDFFDDTFKRIDLMRQKMKNRQTLLLNKINK